MEEIEINKKAFFLESTHADCAEKDKLYWHHKTPLERLEALEFLREMNYGKHATSKRLSRFFEIA